jgi:hypothetical protein
MNPRDIFVLGVKGNRQRVRGDSNSVKVLRVYKNIKFALTIIIMILPYSKAFGFCPIFSKVYYVAKNLLVSIDVKNKPMALWLRKKYNIKYTKKTVNYS